MRRRYDLEVADEIGMLRILCNADYVRKNLEFIKFMSLDELYIDNEGHIWDAYERNE